MTKSSLLGICALVVVPVALSSLGCTATCLRDSDCIRDSVCRYDRCLLVSRGDGGAAAAAPTATSGESGPTGSGGVGSDTTEPRLNLDAAADTEPPPSPE